MQDLERQKAVFIQMRDQCRNSKFASPDIYDTAIAGLEEQQNKVRRHFKNTDEVDQHILEGFRKIIKEARLKLEFTSTLSAGKLAIKEYMVYRSDNKGIKDLILPTNGVFDF